MQNKIMPLSEPLMFKYIFGTSKNKKFTIYLLESLLNYSSKITDLKILNNIDVIPSNLNDNLNLEIAISLYKGNQINLAIENNYNENNTNDIILKTMRNYDALVKKGVAYRDIPNLLQIEFVKGEKEDNIINRIGWVNGTTKEDINDCYCTLIVNIRANKYSQKYKAREDFEIIKELINAETDSEIENLAEKNDIVKEIVNEMKSFSNDNQVQKYLSEHKN